MPQIILHCKMICVSYSCNICWNRMQVFLSASVFDPWVCGYHDVLREKLRTFPGCHIWLILRVQFLELHGNHKTGRDELTYFLKLHCVPQAYVQFVIRRYRCLILVNCTFLCFAQKSNLSKFAKTSSSIKVPTGLGFWNFQTCANYPSISISRCSVPLIHGH